MQEGRRAQKCPEERIWPPLGLPTPYYVDEAVVLYHGDCLELLPLLAPGSVDLVCTDPPWGGGTRVDNTRFKPGHWAKWPKTLDRSKLQERRPVIGDDAPFDPTHLLRFKRCIFWGANWYASRLPDSGGWFVWDKRKGIEKAAWPLSEAELAWTNIWQGVRIFRHRWFGLVRETEAGEYYHPTQKPIALMRWCLERAANVSCVLDPYAGAGATLLAAKDFGCRAIGIEIEERYCAIAACRLAQEVLPFPPHGGPDHA